MDNKWQSENDFYDQVKLNLMAECNTILIDKEKTIPLTARVSILRGALEKYATLKFFDDGKKDYKIQCYMAYNAICQTQILVPSVLKAMGKVQIYDRYSLCDDIINYYGDIDISQGLQAYWESMKDKYNETQMKTIIEKIVDCMYAKPEMHLNYPFKVASKNKIAKITQLQDRYLGGFYQSKTDAKGVYGLLADGTHSMRPISIYGYDLEALADVLQTISQKILADIG